MSSWDSYGKVYALGHRVTNEIFQGEVTIEEKIDGSQFSFGRFGEEIRVRSRNRVFDVHAPESLFAAACETVLGMGPGLVDGWTYRGEVVSKPRHNVLCYGRVPVGNIIIWDIAVGQQDYLDYDAKAAEAKRLGLEVVPLLYRGEVTLLSELDTLKQRQSVLGAVPIEGYVVKNYDRFGLDGKMLAGKWVSEAFKEVHQKKSYGKAVKKDVHAALAEKYCTEARWHKAVQHMQEDGELLGDPKDIGKLIGAVQKDLHEECQEAIKEDLFQAFWKDIARASTRGVAEWYKSQLEKQLFEK